MQGFEPHHADGINRGIVLVLLFAGGLHDLHAFLNLIRSQGHAGTIKAVYTAEHNAEISLATLQWWNEHGAYLGAPPIEQVASNVWELVKYPGILAQRLKHTNENTLVLVGGGSPCQDLSNVNKQHKHKLAGSQSVNYFAIPIITWVARQVCSANVQSYFENVAGADKESKDIMCAALCILPKNCIVVDAAETSWHTRKRIVASTFSDSDSPVQWVPPSREPPFDEGWRPITGTEQLTTMTTSFRTPEGNMRTSDYQARLEYQLYNKQWKDMRIQAVKNQVKIIAAQVFNGDEEILQAFNSWIENPNTPLGKHKEKAFLFINEGLARYGVRPPNVRERAKALGMEEYHSSLQLCEVDIFDLQGRSVDQNTLHTVLAWPIIKWIRTGKGMTKNDIQDPLDCFLLYEQVYARALKAMPNHMPGKMPEKFCVPAHLEKIALLQASWCDEAKGKKTKKEPEPEAITYHSRDDAGGAVVPWPTSLNRERLYGFLGKSGGYSGPEERMCCVIDAILHAVLKVPNRAACTGRCQHITRIATLARRLGGHTDGTIFTDAAWAVFSALAWGIGEPRPELIEYPRDNETTTTVDATQAIIHRSWGPHNGLFIAIATNDPYHVVPITWMDTESRAHTMVFIEHPAAARLITTFTEETLLQMTPLLFGYQAIVSSNGDPTTPANVLHSAIILPDFPAEVNTQIAQHIREVQGLTRHKMIYGKASTIAVIQVANEHCECQTMNANMMRGWLDTLQPVEGVDASARNADILVVWNCLMMEQAAKAMKQGIEVKQRDMGIIWATRFTHSETHPLRKAMAHAAG